MSRRFVLIMLLTGVVLGGLFVLHIATGTVRLAPADVLAALRDQATDPVYRQIVWNLRLPRALVAVAAGAMLGLAGALLQALTRNPLAEPGLTGVSAGAVLLAVLWLTNQQRWTNSLLLPAVALVGGMGAGLLVYGLSWNGRVEPLRLALIGVLVSAVLQSGTSLLLIRSPEALGGVLLWIIGSLNGRVWVHWNMIWPWAAVALPLGLACAGLANVLQLDDDIGRGLGLRIEWARALLLLVAALLTAGAVAVVGAIGFIGLIGPHIARRLIGDDARRVFLLSALLTAAILLGADVVAQGLTITPPFPTTTARAGLPVGAVTALLGAPFFLYLARKSR